MDDQLQSREPESRRKYIWPWFLLAAVVLAIVLAIAWMSVAVNRMREAQTRFPTSSSPTVSPSSPVTNAPTASVPPANDPLAGFRDLLAGGNIESGRKIFFEKPEANCAKCHKVGGSGGDTGSILDGIGSRLSRELILESMVRPNLKISEGFDSVILLLKNGTGCSGFLKGENESEIHVLTPEDGLVTIKKSDVEVRQIGLSPMPEGLDQLLSRTDLRDLVEFLSSLKE